MEQNDLQLLRNLFQEEVRDLVQETQSTSTQNTSTIAKFMIAVLPGVLTGLLTAVITVTLTYSNMRHDITNISQDLKETRVKVDDIEAVIDEYPIFKIAYNNKMEDLDKVIENTLVMQNDINYFDAAIMQNRSRIATLEKKVKKLENEHFN